MSAHLLMLTDVGVDTSAHTAAAAVDSVQEAMRLTCSK